MGTMDAIDVVFRLIGAFYVFAGWLGLRAILMDSVLDKALAALSAGKEDPSETRRRWILGASTVLIGASGAALLTMSSWALPLFVFCAASQAIWIGGARRFFIAPEDDDEAGRRQVRNAAILYGAVALGVVWLWGTGRLLPWDEPFGVVGTALTAAGLGLWFVYHMAWKAASPGVFDPNDDVEDVPAPARIVISPRQGFYPLIDADTGQRFSHMYWYDGTLGFRIEDWDDVFQEAFTLEDVPQGPDFASPEAEAAWRAEGLAIAEALKEILGPENVIFVEGWETGQGADA
ncbi:MAG: hypothetical protein M9945_20110 [Aquamicrobium sp.]|uniref:hypothetical protein n=1 Tax=Aquamicrobium sp. TaxID=1872579 RepID=UPI00349E62FA|nr:hypothetical protein [Aquamicrobium sp.]